MEAVNEGSLDTTIQLDIDDANYINGKYMGHSVYRAQGVSVIGGEIILDGTSIFNGKVGPADVSATITNGRIGFKPDFHLGFEIKNGEIDTFAVSAEGTIYFDFDFELEATAEFSKSGEITVYKHVRTFVQFIGPVPIVEVVTLSFVAGFDAESYIIGTAGFGFSDTSTVEFGAKYKNNSWSQIWEKDNRFHAHEPYWGASYTAPR